VCLLIIPWPIGFVTQKSRRVVASAAKTTKNERAKIGSKNERLAI